MPEQLINADVKKVKLTYMSNLVFLVVLTKEESIFKDITANRNLGGQALSVPTQKTTGTNSAGSNI